MPEAFAGGDRAFLVEGGAQLGDAVERRAGADIFVLVDDDVALPRLDRDRHDLVLEAPGLLRRLRLVLRGDRELVLLLAGDLVLLGDVLRRDAHVVAVEGVDQRVLQHRVDHLVVAHLHALAKMRGVRGHRHRFLPAGDDDVGVAAAICCMPSATARSPEPQSWFRPQAVTSFGTPAAIAACRAGFCPSPAARIWPRMTSVTSSGRDAGALKRALDGDGAELVRGKRRRKRR